MALAIIVLLLIGVISSDCFAFEEIAADSASEEASLFLDVSFSDGGCLEVVIGASRSICGVLATLSYDHGLFSFLTFAKSETFNEQITVSCLDSNGEVRILIDAEDNFNGIWCRFFFSIDQAKWGETARNELSSEVSASAESAYEKTESGYSELFLDGSSERFDLSEAFDREQSAAANSDFVSVRQLDLSGALEKYRIASRSDCANDYELAVGFEVTVSCENLIESYTVLRVLPIASEDVRENAVIIPLPIRDSFYVTVREVGYWGRDVVAAEDTYCFFVCGPNIERVGYDR